ncbi:tyrosine-protein kinase family protein [Methylobacterium crusticola]|uniref:tyrosine-protein kinase family protein n=1 Tax=Methylobacterium crusticola TaxID=1697972 RepID=UPI0013967B69|nr:cellulose synthase operon protein YhjQ/BcsQ [Methylobacterium crusticola]
MPLIVTVHSHRGGVGTTTLASHLAAHLALGGRRVGLADCCLRAPDLHAHFGIDAAACLNDYLWHRTGIAGVTLDLGGIFAAPLPEKGGLYLLPASPAPAEIARLLNEGLDASRLARGLCHAAEALALDLLILDAPAGFGEEALLAAALADCLLVLLHAEPRRRAGTDLTLLERLGPAQMLIVLNQAAPWLDAEALADEAAVSCRRSVAAVLPRCETLGPPGQGPASGEPLSRAAFTAGLSRIKRLLEEGWVET